MVCYVIFWSGQFQGLKPFETDRKVMWVAVNPLKFGHNFTVVSALVDLVWY